MALKKKDASRNPENDKKYARELFWCERDDTWISVEVPDISE